MIAVLGNAIRVEGGLEQNSRILVFGRKVKILIKTFMKLSVHISFNC